MKTASVQELHKKGKKTLDTYVKIRTLVLDVEMN